MKAALLASPGKIVFGDVPAPPLRADEVRFQPVCAGVCGTDVSIYQGHRPVEHPFVLGHEVLGLVTELGKDVTKVAPGQRVVVEPNYPCGECALCRRGRGAVCARKGAMGVNIPGCYSEYAVAPEEFVWRVPDSVGDRDAVTIEPLAVSLSGLGRSGAKPGDTVAVLGCGVVGLLLVHAATDMGVRVIAHDRFPDKVAMARALGAEPMPDGEDVAAFWGGRGVRTVFECAGAPATAELAFAAAPRGADVMLLGLSSRPASLVPVRVVREGVSILTSMIYDHPADFARAVELVASGRLSPSKVVTDVYPLAEIGAALERAAGGASGKVLVDMLGKWGGM
ncbi:MAG: alcohol dehydrogenase catalytic domain-containing protein [Acidobacteriota bacterium]|jgi:threonine dehydrogenase-like Zn-dependent dehydrogenase|nr:alcohol dehydrogenase catalytic domain-containing protein [Acidobacteriota bacterium]